MSTPDTDHLTLTVAEVAAILRISKNSVYDAIHRGDIPVIRFGTRIVIPRLKLERMLGLRPELEEEGQWHFPTA